jgi:hypothetical protein
MDRDEEREPATGGLQASGLIRGAVIHLMNEQPIVADLFGYPLAVDVTLVCTNVRGKTGKRPVWADHTESLFYFPWAQVRFLEVPPDRNAPPPPPEDAGSAIALRAPADESELEIDEDFLRRVRDV